MSFGGMILAMSFGVLCAVLGLIFGYCLAGSKMISVLRKKGWTIIPPEEENHAE